VTRAAAAIAMVALVSSAAAASEPAPPPGTPAWAETADVVEHLGARLTLEPESGSGAGSVARSGSGPEAGTVSGWRAGAGFVDARGRRTSLRALFDGTHPVVLVLAYYECPQLCSLVLDGTVAAMQQLDRQGFRLGREYRVATISFDASERIDQAARKQASVLARLGHPDADWPFLVGDATSVAALTRQLGFGWLRDPATGALAHTAVVFVLTPEGVISRYLYGVDYPARDLKLALLEASGGKLGTAGDRVVMRCFQYDPATRRYGLFITRFMELGGLVILLVVAAVIAGFIRHERRRLRADPVGAPR